MRRIGENLARLLRFAVAACAASAIAAGPAAAANRVFWTNSLNSAPPVAFANLDNTGGGGQLNTMGASSDVPEGVAIDAAANRIYWTNRDNNTISFANLDGSGGGQLNTAGTVPNFPVGLAIDPAAKKIYWTNDGDNTVAFANLDGTGGGGHLNITGATPNMPAGLTIDPATNRIYWTNNGNNTISFANLDGTGGGGELNITGTTTVFPYGIALDAALKRIYWANGGSNTISFANLDNSGGGDLDTNGASVSDPEGVALDPTTNKIYWTNVIGNTISFANLDDTGGGGQLNTTGATPDLSFFLALLKVPTATAAPVVGGGKAPGSVLTCSRGTWAPDVLGAFLYRTPRTYSFAWTRNGVPVPGAHASSIKTSASGEYACRVTAANAAGSTTATSTGHAAGLAACVIKASSRVIRSRRGGALRVRVTCDRAARLTLRGRILARSSAGRPARHFATRPVHASAAARRSLTLSLRLPRGALKALTAGARESATLTLTARDASGTSRTTARMRRLRLAKHGHR